MITSSPGTNTGFVQTVFEGGLSEITTGAFKYILRLPTGMLAASGWVVPAHWTTVGTVSLT